MAGASLSGTTASWFAKFPDRYCNNPYSYNDFNGVQATVSWKIVWTPSSPGETPPTNESVVVRAKGTIFVKLGWLCPSVGSVSSNVSANDASLGLKKLQHDETGSGTPNQGNNLIDGSDTQEVYRDYSFSGTHAAQFSSDGHGGAYAYIAVSINAGVSNTLNLQSPNGYTSRLESKGGINASMKPIIVGSQNVSGDGTLPGSGGPGTGGPVLPGTGPGGGGSGLVGSTTLGRWGTLLL